MTVFVVTAKHPDHGVEVIGALRKKPKNDEVLWKLLTKHVKQCLAGAHVRLSAEDVRCALDVYTTPETTEVELG